MSNVIAIVWDFDKTLISEYMQEPLFKKYNLDSKKFWEESNALPKKYMDEQNVKVNEDTIYLNHILKYVREGKFEGLNNEVLRNLGKYLKFYNGIPSIFDETKNILNEDKYKIFDIKLEHYIVSTGLSEIIKGTDIFEKGYIEDVWGCEFIQKKDNNGNYIIDEIGYTTDNTTKTRALFEINKGANKHEVITVNSSIPKDERRIPFENMIYIADGPSDVPAFSVIKKEHGHTFAIYPKGDAKALKQVEKMRSEGRVEMYAEADYSNETTACLWIMTKVREIAENILNKKNTDLSKNISAPPKHLT